jgi:hypothetical protein
MSINNQESEHRSGCALNSLSGKSLRKFATWSINIIYIPSVKVEIVLIWENVGAQGLLLL